MPACTVYMENQDAGNSFRNGYLHETLEFIAKEKERADCHRRDYFKPDFTGEAAYALSVEKYREEFGNMLGLPYFSRFAGSAGSVETAEAAEDSFSRIFRVRIPVLPGLALYGLLFRNHKGRAPIVVVQHGGQGTPELCGGFFGSENYNEIVRRFLLRGTHVFAPQLLLYQAERFGEKYDRPAVDSALRQLGTSLAALHVYELRKALDWLETLPFVCAGKIGMAGLSYGGFYTLMTAAVDTRIRAAYVSGFFNDRFRYNWTDMILPGQAGRFMDPEIAGLICPRPLFAESGSEDPLFDAKSAMEQSEQAEKYYCALHLHDRFRFRIFQGAHEFCKSDEGVEFMIAHI